MLYSAGVKNEILSIMSELSAAEQRSLAIELLEIATITLQQCRQQCGGDESRPRFFFPPDWGC